MLRSGEPAVLLLTGLALREKGLELAARIAAKTGAKLLAQTFNRRMERGAGRISVERIPYPVDQALERAGRPEAHRAGRQPRAGGVLRLSGQAEPAGAGGLRSSSRWRAPRRISSTRSNGSPTSSAPRQQPIEPAKFAPPAPATGAIDAATLAQSLGALIPENAIVVDEGVSTGRGFFPATRNAHPHTWLQNMGGSIGIGMPLATGAAVACPDRKVLEHPGRRQRDVHDPGAVDAGAREPRHHHRAASTTAPTRSCATSSPMSARRMSAARRSTCSISRAPISTSSRWRAAWACRASASTRMDEFNTAVARGLADAGALSGRGDAGLTRSRYFSAARIAAVSVSQTASSALRRVSTRRNAAAPSGVPITKGWIPITTVVAGRAGSARASCASSST